MSSDTITERTDSTASIPPESPGQRGRLDRVRKWVGIAIYRRPTEFSIHEAMTAMFGLWTMGAAMMALIGLCIGVAAVLTGEVTLHELIQAVLVAGRQEFSFTTTEAAGTFIGWVVNVPAMFAALIGVKLVMKVKAVNGGVR